MTPDLVGVASSRELHCDELTVILLEGGFAGPGALVENASGNKHVWLAGDRWKAYEAVGGPLGPLGAPVGEEVMRTDEGETAEFQNGTISHVFGEQVAVIPPPNSPGSFDTNRCSPVR